MNVPKQSIAVSENQSLGSILSDDKSAIWEALKTVVDPEIPVLTIHEMGILRDVRIRDQQIIVQITPTYSGCPAIDFISQEIKQVLQKQGYSHVQVELVLAPAWTTDWMTDEAKQKLQDYGIAPPCKAAPLKSANTQTPIFKALCPHCQSIDTQLVSEFGSTACKALWRCNSCLEPFDYFKPL